MFPGSDLRGGITFFPAVTQFSRSESLFAPASNQPRQNFLGFPKKKSDLKF